jgi:hypothetical protein
MACAARVLRDGSQCEVFMKRFIHLFLLAGVLVAPLA